ncbi:hypothetical protein [Raineya orbicola]|uniref:Uncharacterized protein n=1 Tax=Raineya orbicola TaxID=2016530 RepID=A0A2N3ICR4_9BACT|nr:hypothetical protein [Raineya orbicola]PKQ68023.1 hypothetical protein Rain11_1834 [Raineya orbicola]
MLKGESIGIRKYILLNENNEKLLTLEYEDLLSFKAHAYVEGGVQIDFEPQGFWGQEILVFKDKEQIASYQLSWLGKINLNYEGKTYSIRYKGFWKPKIQVQNQEKKNLLEVSSRFKWGKLSYEYDFEVIEKTLQENHQLLACLFYATLYLSSFMNGVSGSGGVYG